MFMRCRNRLRVIFFQFENVDVRFEQANPWCVFYNNVGIFIFIVIGTYEESHKHLWKLTYLSIWKRDIAHPSK